MKAVQPSHFVHIYNKGRVLQAPPGSKESLGRVCGILYLAQRQHSVQQGHTVPPPHIAVL